jgi:hypothetical protein
MGRDNAGQRVLNARRTLRGASECLENTFGRTLPDGAQCWVIEEQANYRLVHNCTFPEDERHVIVPQGDKFGRWMRAEGLVGFALLEGGKRGAGLAFGDWSYQRLVQFEVTPEALVYVGSVPRLAHLSASANRGEPLDIVLLQGERRAVSSGSAALLHPGERIALYGPAGTSEPGAVVASLQVILA